MLFGFWYFDWTILIVMPAMLFALWAQMKVTSTFQKYARVITRSKKTAAEAARAMLHANGLYEVQIKKVRGHLSDHYNPQDRTLYLSESVHDSCSAAAVGVACHEAGHALQHANHYAPLNLRMSLVPICNLGSGLSMPIFFVGLLLANDYLMLAGIACFSLVALFQLVTLPVEFNASRRAMEGIRASGIFYDDEIKGARRVLTAAALTYVAALATSLLSILRLLIIANGRSRD